MFDKYQLVALSEAHRLQEEHDFITALIKDPAFPTRVNDIVIEWGNALYQPILDRYVAGEDVPIAELRQVWRNTGFSPFAPWDAPVYEQFFITLRAVNQKLPTAKRLRVLAGDPPVDWTKSKEEIVAVKRQNPRDEHFAAVVEKEVFAKHRKALIIMGGGHLFRHSWNPYSDQQPETVIDILDQRHPKATFVIMVHAFEDRNADLELRLASWHKPGFALLKNTWLGATDTDLVLTLSSTRGFPDGKVVTVKVNHYPGLRLEDLADAYLYFGDLESLTASYPSPAMYRAGPTEHNGSARCRTRAGDRTTMKLSLRTALFIASALLMMFGAVGDAFVVVPDLHGDLVEIGVRPTVLGGTVLRLYLGHGPMRRLYVVSNNGC